MSEKEESLNEQREVEILDEANEKPQNAIQNKDLMAVSVAQVMTETAHTKISVKQIWFSQ